MFHAVTFTYLVHAHTRMLNLLKATSCTAVTGRLILKRVGVPPEAAFRFLRNSHQTLALKAGNPTLPSTDYSAECVQS